ncbi:intraflagellar transport protein 88 homolog [Cimex lectularius]|uniref:Intraflagellar transport protein 88 homolog n=1 Tax=Cimex lectularius TaxID=79782 RepID=A0A8I6SAX3_CIMLE|nr:intraflagellar transport protein 88 homolog [Cimex lectularius]XP_024082443.1 intraflagellar transport protein 88 homolog [Cimex lectularius]
MAFLGRLHAPTPTKDEDELYSGYDDYHPAFNTKNIDQDEYLQDALKSSYGKRTRLYTGFKTPGTAMRLGTSSGYRESSLRPVTGMTDPVNRPMTAVRGAGYTSQRSDMIITPRPSVTPLTERVEERIEDKIRRIEKSITELVDESCILASKKDFTGALEKAKEASGKEKSLIRVQEQSGMGDTHNIDLTSLVLFNLATQYQNNEMNSEAINTYTALTSNRMFQNSNQLKVNMGNLYVRLGQIPKAIKMYRMALDQVPNTYKDLRVKIMHNIGLLFVKMGQYNEACSSFEYIMQERPNFKAGLYTVICYFAMGDKDKMKESFSKLLAIPLDIDEERYAAMDVDPSQKLVFEVIRDDNLRRLERELRNQAYNSILTAAKLIAPAIDNNFTAGYNWCMEAVRNSAHPSLAGDLEVNRALMYLKQRDLPPAIETLKGLQKSTEARLATTAATNLSFIFYHRGEIDEAEKFAELARLSDSYNAAAFVNLGNCALAKGDFEKAKNFYLTAIDNDPTCIAALYNLGLVHKRLEQYEDALDYFLKLHAIMSSHPPVLYQLAHLHQLVGDIDQAIEWFLQLLSIVPADPSILQKLGEIYDEDNDKQQAYHYHYEAFRYLPSDLRVLDWLGAYYVTHRVPEKAIPFYEKAALMQPYESKWPLLIGSCHRRAGNYQAALNTYKNTLTRFPENVECLKYLVRLCSDLGLKETTEYAMELKRAEKAKEIRERISSSRSGSRRSSGRSSSGRGGLSPGNLDSPLPPSRGGTSHQQQQMTHQQHIEASYSDPLGPIQERPRTGMLPPKTPWGKSLEEDFADEEITQDLLPE